MSTKNTTPATAAHRTHLVSVIAPSRSRPSSPRVRGGGLEESNAAMVTFAVKRRSIGVVVYPSDARTTSGREDRGAGRAWSAGAGHCLDCVGLGQTKRQRRQAGMAHLNSMTR